MLFLVIWTNIVRSNLYIFVVHIACDTNAKEYKLNPCEKTCDKCLYRCVCECLIGKDKAFGNALFV